MVMELECTMETKIKKAMDLAKQYHEGQTRTGTGGKQVPYYDEHVERVYEILLNEVKVQETDILVMALLHDTLEDTHLTAKQIESIFGAEIATQVQYLTRNKGQTFGAYTQKLFAEGSDKAILVKLADRLHNLRCMLNVPDKKWIAKKVRQTEVDILEPLSKRTLAECYRNSAQYMEKEIKKEVEHIREILSLNT